jgi:hypothetical protein
MGDMSHSTGVIMISHRPLAGIDFPLSGENWDTLPTIGLILTLFRDRLSGMPKTRPTMRGDKLNGN